MVTRASKTKKLALELYGKQYPEIFAGAYAKAANRTMRGVRRESIKRSAQRAKIRPQKILNRLFYFGKGVQATRKKPRARLRVLYADIAMRLLKHRDTRSGGRGRGVNVAGQGNQRNAFTARMPNGYKGIFERTGRGRLPLFEKEVKVRDMIRRVTRRVLRIREARQFPKELKSAIDGTARREAARATRQAKAGK